MRFHTLILAVACCLWTSAARAADETKEPPMELTLQVDGKRYPIQLDREQKIAGAFNNPTVLLRAAPTRHFAFGGLEFDYPANFTWEADVEGASYRNWSVGGNECEIMYFVLNTEFTPENYTQNMVKQFGKENTTISTLNRKFGRTTLQGMRAIAVIGGIEVVQDAFAIPAPANQWRLLVLQDVAPEKTPKLEEPRRVLDLLLKTLTVKR